ncbi:hypothetical protein [Helicobacter pylori]|nr:hypothetical protein [Helicobacter pylori]
MFAKGFHAFADNLDWLRNLSDCIGLKDRLSYRIYWSARSCIALVFFTI